MNIKNIDFKKINLKLFKFKFFLNIPKKYLIVIFGLILILLILIFQILYLINKQSKLKIQEEVTIKETPTQVVERLYNWYKYYAGSPIDSGAYKTRTELSTFFINDIDNRSFLNKLNYDPFVCQTSKPLGVGVIFEEIKNGTAIVKINTDYGYEKEVSIRMSKEGDEWKVFSIDCPQIEEEKLRQEELKKNRVTIYLLQKKDSSNINTDKKDSNKTSQVQDPLLSTKTSNNDLGEINNQESNLNIDSAGIVQNSQNIDSNNEFNGNAELLESQQKNENIQNTQEKSLCDLSTSNVVRSLDDVSNPLGTAFKELFKGATSAESLQGYTSVFTTQTEKILINISIQEDKIILYVNDVIGFFDSLNDCDSQKMLKQLSDTAKHYGYNQKIEFSQINR